MKSTLQQKLMGVLMLFDKKVKEEDIAPGDPIPGGPLGATDHPF